MSKVDKERALYLDLELTCWDGPTPPGMKREIIQIGIVEMNLTTRYYRAGDFYVTPRRSTVSAYCTELTGITPEMLKKYGRPLSEVIRSLNRFGPRNKLCFTWGDDEAALRRECAEVGVEYPFQMVNYGAIFSLESGAGKNLGLVEALQMYGLEADGPLHDAVSDAMYVARLHGAVIKRNQATLPQPSSSALPPPLQQPGQSSGELQQT